jgi:hypothetical protein
LPAWACKSAASGRPTRAAEPQAVAGKTIEQAYQNIQVLKGVPAEQVIPVMRAMGTSLGVNCQFRYVQGDFSKDDLDNTKTTRVMIIVRMDTTTDRGISEGA